MTKKDAYYFPHDSNAHDDPKMMLLLEQLGLEGYGIYWLLIETLRDQPDYNCPLALLPALARRYQSSTEKFRAVIGSYDLFCSDDTTFYSPSLLRRMSVIDGKRSQARQAALIKWGVAPANSVPVVSSRPRSMRLSEARKLGTHTAEEWEEMREFFGEECVKCGATNPPGGIVRDHIIPIYAGGSDAISNLQPMCTHCNAGKGPDKTDYRLDWCLRNACEMPAKWVRDFSVTSPSKVKERKKKERKKENIYGEFQNVFLTEDEHQKLSERFKDNLPDMIEQLSLGIAQHGYKYKSHYAAVLNWARKDEKKQVDELAAAEDARGKGRRAGWSGGEVFKDNSDIDLFSPEYRELGIKLRNHEITKERFDVEVAKLKEDKLE